MRYLIILLFFGSIRFAHAQDSIPDWKCAITCKPWGLINPVLPNITAGVMFKLSEHLLLELQGGYIYSYMPAEYTLYEKEKQHGFKTNLEFKYVFEDGYYTSLQVFYNRYTKEKNEFFGRNALTYQELISVEKQINTYVGHLKAGVIFPIIDRKLIFDVYGGFGIRYKMVSMLSILPEDATLIERRGVSFSTDNVGNQLYPSLTAGFSLGYILK